MEKRFDGWDDAPKVVQCNQCEHMYTSACDGKDGECKSYKAVRGVRLDNEVKSIRKSLLMLCVAVMLTALGMALHTIFVH